MTTPVATTSTRWWSNDADITATALDHTDGHVIVLDGALTRHAVAELDAELSELGQWVTAGIDGRPAADRIHSLRTHLHQPDAAEELWSRIGAHLGPLRTRGAWTAVGINPRFRVIRYLPGGRLAAHIDGSWRDPDRTVSLVSVVIALSCTGTGGDTRFVGSPTPVVGDGVPVDDPFAHDWDRSARDDEVYARIRWQPGRIAVFDHALRHDGETTTGTKCLLRTDVMYRRTR